MVGCSFHLLSRSLSRRSRDNRSGVDSVEEMLFKTFQVVKCSCVWLLLKTRVEVLHKDINKTKCNDITVKVFNLATFTNVFT